MAIIYASMSNYVEDGYVQTGYVEGQPLSSGYSMTVTGDLGSGLNVSASLSVSTGMIATANVIRTPIWDFVDVSTNMSTLGGLLLSADSAMSTTVEQTTAAVMNIDAATEQNTFTANMDITAAVIHEASMSADGRTIATVTAEAILRPDVYLSTTVDQTTTATNTISAEVSFTTSIDNTTTATVLHEAVPETNTITTEQTTNAGNRIKVSLPLSVTGTVDATAQLFIDVSETYTITTEQATTSTNKIYGVLPLSTTFEQTTGRYILTSPDRTINIPEESRILYVAADT